MSSHVSEWEQQRFGEGGSADEPLSYIDLVPKQRFQPFALSLSPDGSAVAYSANASGQFNLWVCSVDGGKACQLTGFSRRAVRNMAWTPDGRSLVFTADRDGDEQYQIYRIDAKAGAEPEQLTFSDKCQHELASVTPFDPSGRYLVYSVNDRDPQVQEVVVRDLIEGTDYHRLVPASDVMVEPVGISPDGRWLIVSSLRSHTDTTTLLIDLTMPEATPREINAGIDRILAPVAWARDSQGFFVRSDQWDGEFAAIGCCDVAEAKVRPFASEGWDIEHLVSAADTDVQVWSVNESGRSVLHGQRDGEPLPPLTLPDGQVTTMRISADGAAVVLQLDTTARPAEVAVIDLRTGCFRYLTDSRPAGLKTIRPAVAERVSFPSQGGRVISALQYRPYGQGPFPAVIWVHGGPHGQERPVYGRAGLYQYLAAHQVAMIGPDMAGSTGYGTSFEKLLYRDWGGADLEDFAAALTYLCSLDWIDSNRIAIAGGSYGGFAALSCLARIDHPWAAGVSICGPSNLLTLAAACPPTWRSFVDRVLGNPETDASRLLQRSPITYAERITAPLYVIQGAKDPRVPRAESDQIVEKLRQGGVDVRYDVYPDEGHGFTSRANEIEAYTEIGRFLLRHLT